MSYQVPTTAMPASLVVGDYWTWRVPALGDFPASTWTLSFAFAGPNTVDVSSGWTVTAESAGTWLVVATKAQTVKYTAGRYRWRVYVTSGSERYEVGSGWVVFEENVAALTGDNQTHAQTCLAMIEKALQGRLTTQEESYSIAGRSIGKMPIMQLRELRGFYATEVWRETHPGTAMPSTGLRFTRAS
jgi:hypothetical protein